MSAPAAASAVTPSTTSTTTPVVERLLFALVNAQLYGPVHARVREASTEIASLVRDHCARAGAPSMMLGAVAEQVVIDGRPVLGASLFAKRLLQRIDARGAGGVEFQSGVGADDVMALVEVLARRAGPTDKAGSDAELSSRRVTSIRFMEKYGGGGGVGDGDGGVEGKRSEGEKPLLKLHQQTVDLLQGITIATCQGRDLDVGRVAGTVEEMIAGLDRDAGFLHGLANYPEYDFFTFGHSIRVALVALDVARRTTDDVSLLHRIGTAALLHDVGKALIQWDVLHKRGPLTPEERNEMQRHPVLGAGILLANKESDPLAVAAAYGHHCCTDGKGYPWSCGEHEQSIVTRLVKICDVYEALTAVRPYKNAMTPARAYRTMLGMRGHFDEQLLAHFIRTVGIFPPGTRVRLNDGSVARVSRQTDDLHRPIVDIVEIDGEVVGGEDGRRIDLTRPAPGDPTRVTETLAALDAARMLA
jgi:HD-GYP domain-containing protein (c-di-GMP phosphodiesterase class II)